MNFEFSYTDSSYDMSLIITDDGLATLTIGNNRTDPDFNVLGLFRGQLKQQHMSELVSAMQSREFRNVQNPYSALPGEPVRQLCLKEEGRDEIMKWAAFNTPSPIEFTAVEERALAIVHLIRQHPVYAISANADAIPSELERDNPVEFDVKISNPGSETINIGHPENWSDDVVNLQMIGMRSDIPLEQLADYHQKFEDLTKEHMVYIQGEKADEPLITILSNGNHLFKVRVGLDWPPGQYDVQFFFCTTLLDQDGKEQLDCQFLSRSFSTKIVGESKPEDEPDNEEDELEDEDMDELEQ